MLVRGVRQAESLSALTPAMVEAISLPQFINMGLNESQAACAKNVARRFLNGWLPANLGMLHDIAIKNLLLPLRGIGAHLRVYARACVEASVGSVAING